MLDDSDVDLAVFAGPDGDSGSVIGAVIGILFLVAVCVMLYVVHENKKECGQRHCDHGTPILTNHECLCVEKAK